jgi:hypothetical protein
MNARTVTYLLVAGLAVIAFSIWLSSKRHLDRDMASGDLVLPGLEQGINDLATVTLSKGDQTHTTLKRVANGWNVAEREWPADASKVRKLLLDLGALNIVEEKTRLPANYPALGVEDISSPKAGGTLVELTAPSHSWSLIVGKSSGAKSGFVRVTGAPQSLLAAPLLSVDADPKSWLQHDLIDVPVTRIREVEEKPAQGAAFSVKRDKASDGDFAVAPLPKGRSLTSPAAGDAIPGALTGLSLDDVRKAPATADATRSQATFRTFDGLEIVVSGRKDGAHSLVTLSATSSAAGTAAEAQKLNGRCANWEFEIPDYKYTAIFTPLEDLLVKPPEPAKKAAAKAPSAAPAPSTR